MKKTKTPNYLEQLFGMSDLSPGLHHITVEHEDSCDLLNGRGHCNCNSIVRRGTPDGKILEDG